VMILWTNGEIRIPIAWSIWHKENKKLIGYTNKKCPKYQHTGLCLLQVNGQSVAYRTKNQIALSLLNATIKQGINPNYITFDAWYAGVSNLSQLHLLYLMFYSRIKGNRKVIYQNEILSVEQLAQKFPITSFDHKHDAYIKALVVFLPSFGWIKLLLVRKDHHVEPGSTKFIFTNDLNASAPEILLRYRTRWLIETTIRDIKQHLNLASCQARGIAQQEHHLALCFLAFILLELQPNWHFQNYSVSTIGEKKQLLSSLSFITFKEQFFLLEHQKMSARLIPLQLSGFDQVSDCLDFAFSILKN